MSAVKYNSLFFQHVAIVNIKLHAIKVTGGAR